MKELTKNVVEWIKGNTARIGAKKAIIGISGGKDSTVVAALCVEALGKENVFGLLMPNGEQKDIYDSYRVVDYLGINYDIVNIGDAFREIGAAIPGFYESEIAKTNLPARLRMSTLYAYGQTIGAVVIGTDNADEAMLGYSTFGGDGFASLMPNSKLTVDEVIEIGDDLGLPYDLVHKVPADGLQDKTDEDNLGFTYREVSDMIRKNIKGPNFDKIIARYRANRFKTEIQNIPCFDPGLPNYVTGENV